ncbi:MAG TPA: tetratricopeptide repeat protein, partial [Usitatibacter sp.]|nr:tetratricopeptide repeat protein [Usitatibacter sp.]
MNTAELLDRLVREGDALINSGRFAEGEARAREVLARQPKSAAGQYLMGLSSLMQERAADALAYFEGAMRTDRVNPNLHFMAGLANGKLGRVDDAIAAYRRALQYQPEFVEARANLAYLLEHAGKIDEAAECYRRALVLAPNEWTALNRLGYCERLMGQPNSSLQTLEKALAINPRSAPTLNEVALTLLQLERPDEAVAKLREAVAVDPDFAAGWANLCKLLYVRHLEAAQAAEAAGTAMPDPAPVVECFDKLLEFEPSNVEFRYLRDGLAGVRVERPPNAYIETFFDRFAPRYEERLGELVYIAPEIVRRFLGPWLEGRSGLRVADLGCGTGHSGTVARPQAARLTGVDLSSGMLDIARARDLYDELEREEIGDWLARQAPQSLDLILALDVFIYVGDLDRVLQAAAAALAQDGRFVFTIESLASGGDFRLLPAGRYAH